MIPSRSTPLACQSGLYRAMISEPPRSGCVPADADQSGRHQREVGHDAPEAAAAASVLKFPNVVVRAWNAVPARIPPISAPATLPMPPTTVSITRARLMKMMNVSALTLTDALDKSTPRGRRSLPRS